MSNPCTIAYTINDPSWATLLLVTYLMKLFIIYLPPSSLSQVFLAFPDALRPAFPRLKDKLDDPDVGE